MKKLMFGLAVAGLCSAAFAAESDIVGYTKRTVPAKTWALVANNFQNVDGSAISIQDIFPTETLTASTLTANASQIQIAKASGSGFDQYYYCNEAYNEATDDWDLTAWVKLGDDMPTDVVVPTCTGFWIQNPTAVEIYFTR